MALVLPVPVPAGWHLIRAGEGWKQTSSTSSRGCEMEMESKRRSWI
jgi:hypothetical protein